MPTLILTQPEVRALLPIQDCIEVVAEALAALARGEGSNPLRRGMRLADGRSLLGTMPGFLGSAAAPGPTGLKVVGVFPGNHGTPWDGHQGVVVLFDPSNGVPRAILDASEITAIRTAAASGVATRLLAREESRELAILGSGVEARTHLEAMIAVRKIVRARVHSPSAERREDFARKGAERFGIPVVATATAREAVEGADVVCTTTSSSVPVLLGSWLAPGTHVNAVGACLKGARELDAEAVRRSRLYVDRRESALAESGDFLIARSEGAVGDEHIVGEIGEVLAGLRPGRGSPDEITLFESLGIAVEDLAAADLVDRRARERGIGTWVELGGRRESP